MGGASAVGEAAEARKCSARMQILIFNQNKK
jgi:hypothetical protein